MENLIKKLCDLINNVIKNATLHIYDSWYCNYRDEKIKSIDFISGDEIKITTESKCYLFTIDELDVLSEGKVVRRKVSTTEVDTHIEFVIIF